VSFARLAAVVAALGALAPAAAHASDADAAAALAAEGRQLGDDKKFADALAKFRQAYALDARTEYLCNIGFSHYALDALPEAFVYLELCRARGEKPKGLDDVVGYVRSKIDGSAAHARVTVTVDPAGVSAEVTSPAVDGGAALPAPYTAYVPIGAEIAWTASASGHEQGHHRQTFSRAVDHTVTIQLRATHTEPPTREPRRGTAEPAGARLGTGQPPDDTPDRSPPSRLGRVGGWLAAGSAALALGVGIYAYSEASARVDEIDEHFARDPPDRDDLESQFRLWYGIEWGSFAAAGIAAGISAWLFLRADHSDRERTPVAASPTADGRGGMLWLTWSR